MRFSSVQFGSLNLYTALLARRVNWCKGVAGTDSDSGRTSTRGQRRLGCDRVFAVNYLGHFLLVNRLLPLLVHSAPSRIVSVTSSVAHAAFLPDDFLFDRA